MEIESEGQSLPPIFLLTLGPIPAWPGKNNLNYPLFPGRYLILIWRNMWPSPWLHEAHLSGKEEPHMMEWVRSRVGEAVVLPPHDPGWEAAPSLGSCLFSVHFACQSFIALKREWLKEVGRQEGLEWNLPGAWILALGAWMRQSLSQLFTPWMGWLDNVQTGPAPANSFIYWDCFAPKSWPLFGFHEFSPECISSAESKSRPEPLLQES